ncbi:MAG: hypothetical protein LAT68_12785 [Cyclobacteriaceae bacterium]|nr:hypothetical protein [Cyclobacteriaceae bacterium]MCH8517195.1 hypothetical protein [Cyclobacteriaceae bacterium]
MRVVKEFNRGEHKITIFQWNEKYLVKLENPIFEQTYKIKQADVLMESELEQMVDEQFVEGAQEIFEMMMQNIQSSISRNNLF